MVCKVSSRVVCRYIERGGDGLIDVRTSARGHETLQPIGGTWAEPLRNATYADCAHRELAR
jgi:hypothetical protein